MKSRFLLKIDFFNFDFFVYINFIEKFAAGDCDKKKFFEKCSKLLKIIFMKYCGSKNLDFNEYFAVVQQLNKIEILLYLPFKAKSRFYVSRFYVKSRIS